MCSWSGTERNMSTTAWKGPDEVEIKLRLPSRAAYDAVAALLAPSWAQDHVLEDFYFDGSGGELDAALLALRCRIYDHDKRAMLTVKGKPVMHEGVSRASEAEEELPDPAAARAFVSDPRALFGLELKLIEDCRRQCGLTDLVSLGGFTNLRREFDWEGHVLQLDKATFAHGTLYELELETSSPEKLRPKLEAFLLARGIEFGHSAASKFANFRHSTLR
mmetsp:Transcript_14760/g.41565  ORF Transcript_14760/g.41565 Transcript_14760/m.41565 type:complete len:219 (+) Transcript_14760:110-766(+)